MITLKVLTGMYAMIKPFQYFTQIIFVYSIFLGSPLISIKAVGNDTSVYEEYGREGATEFQTYLVSVAALASIYLFDKIKDIVAEKDFARNFGMKIAESWEGFRGYFKKENQVKRFLSSQLTGDMSRILEEAMKQGLKQVPLDGKEGELFTPGYFDVDGGYFAWQNFFPSTTKPGEIEPGLVLFIPSDRRDAVCGKELRPLAEKEDIDQAYLLTEQLLNVILPPESKREPLLKDSLGEVPRWFFHGSIRSSLYLGEEKVRDGVQILRLLDPNNYNQGNFNLLGTLIYFPDLTSKKIDLKSPLLLKPQGEGGREWKKNLPKRIKWFLKMKPKYFTTGATHASTLDFAGRIINQDTPKTIEIESERELEHRRRLEEQERLFKEALLREKREKLDQMVQIKEQVAQEFLKFDGAEVRTQVQGSERLERGRSLQRSESISHLPSRGNPLGRSGARCRSSSGEVRSRHQGEEFYERGESLDLPVLDMLNSQIFTSAQQVQEIEQHLIRLQQMMPEDSPCFRKEVKSSGRRAQGGGYSDSEASDDEDLPDSEDEQTYDLQLTPGQSPLSRSHAVLNLSAMISPTTQQQEGGIDNESEYTIVNLTPARQPVFPETRQPEDSSSSRWL